MAATIVFIGDSITDAGRREDPEKLGHGYVRIVAVELAAQGDARAIVNNGVSGDRAVDLRARWDDDALSYEPELLSIYVGINDTWRRYDSGDPTSVDDFAATYRVLLEEAQARFAPRFILMEPFVVPVTGEQKHWADEDLDAKRAVVAELAARRPRRIRSRAPRPPRVLHPGPRSPSASAPPSPEQQTVPSG